MRRPPAYFLQSFGNQGRRLEERHFIALSLTWSRSMDPVPGSSSCTAMGLRITIVSTRKATLISPSEIIKGRQRPQTAIFAAALIVFIQLVSTSHYHNLPSSSHAAQTQLSAEPELCPICLVAFHAPGASSRALAQFSPKVEIHSVLASDSSEKSEIAFEDHFGRAPPASL